jgi:asparagine synthase (glutamine-hydrolysing)
MISGIAGIFGPADAATRRREVCHMLRAMPERGDGDAPALWSDDAIALGHITTRSAQKTVHTSHDATVVVVADARLDNRDALLRHLGAPADATDAALIARAYRHWGLDFADHLLGAFAVALWDSRNHRLVCVRDHFGLRPFVYAHRNGRFAFASTTRALRQLDEVSTRIDRTRAADYLMLMLRDQERTFYEDIRRLPPAHTLTVTPDGLQFYRYWTPTADPTLALPDDAAYAEAFEERFLEAVRCRLRDAERAGTMLSGGLDSSGITGVARSLLGATDENPLPAFSFVFDTVTKSDEREYMDAVVDQGSLQPFRVIGDEHHALEHLDALLDVLDEPFFTPNLFLYVEIWQRARDAGVTTLLDGFLGDSVVGHGMERLAELALTGRWLRLLRALQDISQVRGYPRRTMMPFLLRQHVLAPLRQAFTPSWIARRSSNPQERGFAHPGLLRETRWVERVRDLETTSLRSSLTVRGAHMKEITHGHLQQASDTVLRAAPAWNVDVRLPFADRRLLEFCPRLPPDQRYRDGHTRYVQHEAIKSYLPRAIYRRPSKGNLSHNFDHGLRTLGRDALHHLLHDQVTVAGDVIDIKTTQQALDRFMHAEAEGHVPYALWRACVLVRWLERLQ